MVSDVEAIILAAVIGNLAVNIWNKHVYSKIEKKIGEFKAMLDDGRLVRRGRKRARRIRFS